MLDEYFSFAISDSGEITSLPLVLPGYSPDLSKLPLCASFPYSFSFFPRKRRLITGERRVTVLLRLGAHVDWENEKPCFETFLRELAFFYSPAPSPVVPSPSSSLPTPPPSAEPDAPPSSLAVAPPTLPPPVTATPPSPEDDARLKRESEIKHSLQHVVFPALKQYLVPPQKLLKRDVVLATSLENLYRVFERC
jgi:DNA mismatch repair protein MLH1